MNEIDKIQDFVNNNLFADVPTDTYNKILDDSENMDLHSFVQKWDEFLYNNSDGWNKVKPKTEELSKRISDAFKDDKFNPSEGKREELYKEKFSDVPREQFNTTLSNMKNYYEDEVKAREYEAGKARRAKEVKDDWGLVRNILASDYEKQRYIEDPESALFGKEAGDDILQKGEAISDLSYGVAGAAGDVIPGLGALVGPGVRAMRDVQHKVTGSPYQKEGEDIVSDVISDAAINLGTEYLPTALVRRGARGGKNVSKTRGFLMDVSDEMKQNARTVQNLKAEQMFDVIADNANDVRALETIVERMPDSDIKVDLNSIIKKEDFKPNDILSYMDEYKNAKIEGVGAYKTDPKTGAVTVRKKSEGYLGDSAFDYFKKEEQLKTRPKSATRSFLAKAAGDWGPAAQTFVKEADTAKGRSKKAEIDEEKVKDWYKANYSRDWELDFKPKKKDGDPKWEAYKEWYIDKYGTSPDEEEE